MLVAQATPDPRHPTPLQLSLNSSVHALLFYPCLFQVCSGSSALWFEDPLQVEYSEEWSKLCQSARVPICTGENLARRQGFRDFIVNHGCDILPPDLRNSGGFLETKRTADMADVFEMPLANHNTGSQLHTWATCQWAGSIPDYMTREAITGTGGWMDQLLLPDGPYIKDGFVQVTDKPGQGVELNPDVARAHLAAGEVWWG